MYITVQSIKRKVGFKGLETTDIVVGLPLFIILLLLFSFENLRIISLIMLVIAIFLFLPVNLSKKNRMYKVLFLVFRYLVKDKEFIYKKKDEKKEGNFIEIISKRTRKKDCKENKEKQ